MLEAALLALVVQIPFELRHTIFGLSNLQWTFLAVLVISIPKLITNWKAAVHDRLIQVTAIFAAVQWAAAIYAPEFHANAYKAAARFSVGFLLVVVTKYAVNRKVPLMLNTWALASAAAAFYALADYAGFGWPALFRTEEFYIGQVQRLSGSFDYPNTAAAYFALSLPIIWWSSFRPAVRGVLAFAAWCAIILTFSKGALLAVPLVVLLMMRRSAVPLIAIGAGAYAALLPLNPYLVERIYGPGMRNPIAVEYKTEWNHLEQQPHTRDAVPIEIRSTGITTLRAQGRWRYAIAYRWWRMDTQTFVEGTPIVSPLPADIVRERTVTVNAAFETPDQPGRYLLVVELFSRNFDWFSRMRIVPALVQVDVQPNVSRAASQVDLSTIYNRGRNASTSTAAVSRNALWKAAVAMFAHHPFGVGPDNYRLQYGKYLGVSRWDTKIYSNNLYLELLTGSGILGLAAFGFVIAARRWTADPPSISVAIFLVHGIVDVFLMTTPIYMAFWISVGAVCDQTCPNSNRSIRAKSRLTWL